MGHAAFFDYPNVAGVDSADWEGWLNKYYNCKNCNALNTLFLHYFVAKPEYSHGCAREIVRTMFNAVPDLHYCFLIVPTGVYPGLCLLSLNCYINFILSLHPIQTVLACMCASFSYSLTDSAIADIFNEMDRTGERGSDAAVVFTCMRHEHVPVLHVRAAR